jgi:hypothetical protein
MTIKSRSRPDVRLAHFSSSHICEKNKWVQCPINSA